MRCRERGAAQSSPGTVLPPRSIDSRVQHASLDRELGAGSWELVVVDDMSHGQNRRLTFREEQTLSPDTVTESSLLTDCPRESFIENRSSVLHEYSVLMEVSLLRHPPIVLAKVFTTLFNF
jgi:hypothetical protein